MSTTSRPRSPSSRPWFRAKLYGWGWTPVTWQGWLATLLMTAILAACLAILSSFPSVSIATFCGIILFLNGMFFTVLCFKKGEMPYWRWGNKK